MNQSFLNHVCGPEELSCFGTNQCIPKDQWCNSKIDCLDSSDETGKIIFLCLIIFINNLINFQHVHANPDYLKQKFVMDIQIVQCLVNAIITFY